MTNHAPGSTFAGGWESAVRAGFLQVRREVLHLLAACNPLQRRRRMRWENEDGVVFLGGIGIAPGDTVVDFGCGSGAYTIPAAVRVGAAGLVVAVDVRARAMVHLSRRVAARGLHNIRTASSVAEVPRLLEGRGRPTVLLYDVLHMINRNDRRVLYGAFREILGPGGALSVHPAHVQGDHATGFFRGVTIEDLVREIEDAGFGLRGRREARLWHGHGCVTGTVLSFTRTEGQPAGAERGSTAAGNTNHPGQRAADGRGGAREAR